LLWIALVNNRLIQLCVAIEIESCFPSKSFYVWIYGKIKNEVVAIEIESCFPSKSFYVWIYGKIKNEVVVAVIVWIIEFLGWNGMEPQGM